MKKLKSLLKPPGIIWAAGLLLLSFGLCYIIYANGVAYVVGLLPFYALVYWIVGSAMIRATNGLYNSIKHEVIKLVFSIVAVLSIAYLGFIMLAVCDLLYHL